MAAARPLTDPRRNAIPRPVPSWRFAASFAAVIAAISLVPYILAVLLTPTGHHFGGFFFIADDATTYLAKMRQGADGAWRWTDPYTSEAHSGVFLFGFYLLAGHVAALLHLPLIAVYHLAGVTGAFALILAIDRLATQLLRPEDRRLGVVLAVLGSGLGFVVQAAGNPSVGPIRLQALDLHLPELSGWYSILAIPHFAWATALIIASFLGLRAIAVHPTLAGVVRTGLVLLALTAIHPQMVAVIALIWGVALALEFACGERPRPRALAAEAAAFACAAPLLGYNAWILYRDPTIAAWASQWRHQAPDPLSLLVSLGIPLVLAALAIWHAVKDHDKSLAVLLVWPPLVFVLLYLPNIANIQRRLLDALYVPIGLLAAVGVRRLLRRVKRPLRWRRLVVAVSCLSSVLVLAIALRFATGAFPEMYVSDPQWQAMAWLSTHHQASDRVLSSPQVGLDLPAFSGVSVYVGHYSETIDYFAKIQRVDTLLRAATTPAQFQAFAAQNGITLLYWGPNERSGRDFDPGQQPSLDRVYDQAGVQIYRIVPGG